MAGASGHGSDGAGRCGVGLAFLIMCGVAWQGAHVQTDGRELNGIDAATTPLRLLPPASHTSRVSLKFSLRIWLPQRFPFKFVSCVIKIVHLKTYFAFTDFRYSIRHLQCGLHLLRAVLEGHEPLRLLGRPANQQTLLCSTLGSAHQKEGLEQPRDKGLRVRIGGGNKAIWGYGSLQSAARSCSPVRVKS
jgi:hypothetical protein